uniref:Uncharacterized protein n=1 Tax=Cacopsylla melanoneura TaxID=428564 RepID=A0A8D9BRV0_9HEMI
MRRQIVIISLNGQYREPYRIFRSPIFIFSFVRKKKNFFGFFLHIVASICAHLDLEVLSLVWLTQQQRTPKSNQSNKIQISFGDWLALMKWVQIKFSIFFVGV